MKPAALFVLMLLVSLRADASSLAVEDITFASHGVKLSASVVFPGNHKAHAAVVFVHGSGRQVRNMRLAERFASQGIAILVYDKRGAGKSGGEYEEKQSVSGQNIELLADDAVAALNALRQHPRTKGLPIGLAGISQAGWIVPLAAEKSRSVDFMVLWSGPVCKVSEEDIFSKHTGDVDAKTVPSYLEALNARKQPYIWPAFLGKDTDPSESLAKLNVPGLWIFGARDGSIPVDLSVQRLKKLSDNGRKYDYVVFSSQGHNNMSETLATAIDWIGRLGK